MSEASTSPTSQTHLPAAAALSHAEIMRVMAGVMICILLAALDQTVVIPALPAIASELGAYSQLSWIVAAYLITSTISTPIYSKFSDIYGRRRLLIVCIGLFIATSMLCAMAQSLSQLVWFRALQGLGGGGLMALTQAAIADVMSPRQRGRYQAYISARLGCLFGERTACRRLPGPGPVVALDILDQSAGRRGRDVGLPQRTAPVVTAEALQQAKAGRRRHAFAVRVAVAFVAGFGVGRRCLRLGIIPDFEFGWLRHCPSSPADPAGTAGE